MFTLKNKMIIGLLVSSAMLSSVAIAVEPVLPSGCYALDGGKLAISANIPGFLKLNASSPAMGLLQATNSFTVDNGFVMSLPILSSLNLGLSLPSDFNGTWEMGNKNKFTVNFTDIEAMVADLQDMDPNAKLIQRFSGKVLEGGDKIKGNFLIKLKAKLAAGESTPPIKVSGKISGSFTGTRTSIDPCPLSDKQVLLSGENVTSPKGLAGFLEDLQAR